MRIRIIPYNKYRYSPDAFEAIVRKEIEESAYEVVGFQVTEQSNGDLLFQIQYGAARRVSQTACILAWLDPDTAESTINSTLEGVEQLGKHAKFISTLALAKSSRMLAALVIVQSESESAVSNGQQQVEEQKQEAVQDAQPATKPNRRAKGNRVGKD